MLTKVHTDGNAVYVGDNSLFTEFLAQAIVDAAGNISRCPRDGMK